MLNIIQTSEIASFHINDLKSAHKIRIQELIRLYSKTTIKEERTLENQEYNEKIEIKRSSFFNVLDLKHTIEEGRLTTFISVKLTPIHLSDNLIFPPLAQSDKNNEFHKFFEILFDLNIDDLRYSIVKNNEYITINYQFPIDINQAIDALSDYFYIRKTDSFIQISKIRYKNELALNLFDFLHSKQIYLQITYNDNEYKIALRNTEYTLSGHKQNISNNRAKLLFFKHKGSFRLKNRTEFNISDLSLEFVYL